MKRDGLAWMARNNKGGNLDRDAVRLQFNDVAGRDLLLAREIGTNQRRVIPRQFRKRFRQFLKPAVVGVSPVPQRWIWAKHELDVCAVVRVGFSHQSVCQNGGKIIRNTDVLNRCSSICPCSIVQRLLPNSIESPGGLRRLVLPPPIVEHNVVTCSIWV